MQKPLKKLSVLLTATALAAALAGCSAEDQARLDKFCQQNGINDCHIFLPGGSGEKPAPSPAEAAAEPGGDYGVSLTAIGPEDAPAELAEWAQSVRFAEESGHKAVTADGYTYVAIAGGLQGSGGYRVEVDSIIQKDGVWTITASVVPPSADQMVTTAMENPVGFFRTQELDGEIQVKVQQAQGADKPVTNMPVEKIRAQAIELSEAPDELQTWAQSQRTAEESGSHIVHEGDKTYVAIAGGMQRSGGYRIEVGNVVRKDGGWQMEAKVIPPAPGTMVTMALQNPVGVFQFPKLDGEIEVTVHAPGGSSIIDPGSVGEPTLQVAASWAEPERVHLHGTAPQSDLQFAVKLGGQVVAQADAQVKDGQFIGNVLVSGGAKEGMELVVSDPESGDVLLTLPLSDAAEG